jgi:hypothetical protein
LDLATVARMGLPASRVASECWIYVCVVDVAMGELVSRHTVYVPRGRACRRRVVVVERKLRAMMVCGGALLNWGVELLAVPTDCVAVFLRVDARAARHTEHAAERDQS